MGFKWVLKGWKGGSSISRKLPSSTSSRYIRAAGAEPVQEGVPDRGDREKRRDRGREIQRDLPVHCPFQA